MKYEYLGNIYEVIGREGDLVILQSVNDDHYVKVHPTRFLSAEFRVISD